MSRNKIFRCAYFSMHFRIKFLLFNDFPSCVNNFDLTFELRYVLSHFLDK